MNKQKEFLSLLEEAKHYKKGWNGYDALPIKKIDIKYARQFIDYCAENYPDLFNFFHLCSFDCGIQIDGLYNERFFMEIEFSSKQIKLIFHQPIKNMQFRILNFNVPRKKELLWETIINEIIYQLQVLKIIKERK